MRRAIFIAVLIALAAAAPAAARSDVVFTQQALRSGGAYTEGAIQFLRVVRVSTGRVVVAKRLTKPVHRTLRKGTYRVRSWTRPCDGNCSNLDPPVSGCHTTLHVDGFNTLTSTVQTTVGAPCKFLTSSTLIGSA